MDVMRRGRERSLGAAFDALMADPREIVRNFGGLGAEAVPPMDVRETEEAYVVALDMPGFGQDDVEVTLEGRALVIRGHRAEEREAPREQGQWLLRERRRASFTRSVVLPGPIDPDAVTSSYENGELRLTLPKSQQARPRRIPVRGSAEAAKQVGGGQGRSPEEAETG